MSIRTTIWQTRKPHITKRRGYWMLISISGEVLRVAHMLQDVIAECRIRYPLKVQDGYTMPYEAVSERWSGY